MLAVEELNKQNKDYKSMGARHGEVKIRLVILRDPFFSFDITW